METAPIKNGVIIHSLSQSVSHGLANVKNVPPLLKMVMEDDMWQHFIVKSTKEEVSFDRFEDFLSAAVPRGLGTDQSTLDQMEFVAEQLDRVASAKRIVEKMSPEEREQFKTWMVER